MANRYWVGGTGTWDSSNTNKWSAAGPITVQGSRSGNTLTTTNSPALVVGMTLWYDVDPSTGTFIDAGTITGGSANSWTTSGSGTISTQTMYAATVGASVPTSSDNVFFPSGGGSNACTVTLSGNVYCNNLNYAGYSYIAGSGTLYASGSITMNATPPGASFGSNTIYLSGAGSGRTITSSGTTFYYMILDGGGSISLGDACTLSYNFILSYGSFNTAGNAFTFNAFDCSGSLVRSLTLGASVVTATAPNNAWYISGSNVTLSAGTSTIRFTGNTPSLNTLSSLTYYNVEFNGTGGYMTVHAATYNSISSLVYPATIYLDSGATTYVTSLGNGSSPAARVTYTTWSGTGTVSRASGTVSVSNCVIANLTAAGGAKWKALLSNGNVDGGGNTGWIFTEATGNFLGFF